VFSTDAHNTLCSMASQLTYHITYTKLTNSKREQVSIVSNSVTREVRHERARLTSPRENPILTSSASYLVGSEAKTEEAPPLSVGLILQRVHSRFPPPNPPMLWKTCMHEIPTGPPLPSQRHTLSTKAQWLNQTPSTTDRCQTLLRREVVMGGAVLVDGRGIIPSGHHPSATINPWVFSSYTR
jgi:hypothetical protein